MSFASRLRQAREQTGLTQLELAEKLGITKSAVGNYENGVSCPKWDVLVQIFDVLHVEPNFLYQDSFSPPVSDSVHLTPAQSALLTSFDQLNEEGQSKVIGYVEDLNRTGYYKRQHALRGCKRSVKIKPPNGGFDKMEESEMKKRLVSLALAALLLVAVPLSAFATSKFNTSVLSGRENVSISYFDEMTGNVTASLTGDAYNSSVTFDNGALLTVDPTICLNDSFDYYRFNFNCLETAPIGMTSIIIKIGDNRYNFTNCATSLVPLGDNAYWENIYFVLKRETVGFMNDFVKHRDEEIKVRINGTYTTLDFSLTDEMKNEILDLYALYDDGRGTRDANLRDITYTDSTSVYKNGKFIDGLVKEEVIHILAHSF